MDESIRLPSSGCQAFAPFRPASGSPPALPVGWLISPTQQLSSDGRPVPFQVPGSCRTVIPSAPGLPLLALSRFNACLQFSRLQTSSINCSSLAGLFVFLCASPRAFRSLLEGRSGLHPFSSIKANCSWFFCRFPLASRAAYSPLPSTPCGDRLGLHHSRDYYARC